MKCGLLGGKLGHSYSPQIHRHLGSYSYELFEKQPEELGDFLKNGDFDGLNVTIPYKKAVMDHCSELSPRAQRLGAVNTLVRRSDGSLIGHNTDFFGFEMLLNASKLDVSGKKVLVLGSGGASNTAVAVLRERGAHVIIISRGGENNYENLLLHGDASVIINTTPVGMYPHVGISPVDLSLFPKLEGVLDVIYNPARTQLLMNAENRGLVAINGLLMLVAQAKESAEWFTASAIPNNIIAQIHRLLLRQMENIVLIGMPGSGKTTVGQLLAARCGKKFVDADQYIAEAAGKSIPEIFAQGGEAAFRRLETEILAKLCKESGTVIATGGGCVTQERNYPLLYQNGMIFCLDRPLEKLPTDGRPLSQANKLSEMYQMRKPMYDRFADHHIDNNGTAEAAVLKILAILEGKL